MFLGFFIVLVVSSESKHLQFWTFYDVIAVIIRTQTAANRTQFVYYNNKISILQQNYELNLKAVHDSEQTKNARACQKIAVVAFQFH